MTRQSEHQKRKRADGWTTLQVWLSPEEQQRFAVLVKRCGSKTQAFRAMLEKSGGEHGVPSAQPALVANVPEEGQADD